MFIFVYKVSHWWRMCGWWFAVLRLKSVWEKLFAVFLLSFISIYLLMHENVQSQKHKILSQISKISLEKMKCQHTWEFEVWTLSLNRYNMSMNYFDPICDTQGCHGVRKSLEILKCFFKALKSREFKSRSEKT